MVGIHIDVTEYPQAIEALRECERRLRLIYDSSSDGLALLQLAPDQRVQVVSVNATLLRATGLMREQVEGRFLHEILSEAHRDLAIRKCRDALLTQSTTTLEHFAELPVGWRSGEISFIPVLPTSGPVSHLLISIRDTTAVKAAEAARHREAQSKDEFLATLAHELRNPLAPICTIAELLCQSDWDAARTREFGLVLRRQSQHLTRMVDDLLDLAHITRGAVQLRMEQCALGEIIRDAVQMLEADIEAKHQVLSVQWLAGALIVDGDSSRLAQVFANLIANANKYSAERGVIEIVIEQQGGEAVVRIKDQGVGIDSHLLPLIFDSFTQADRTLDRRDSGLGIGLAIAKRLVTIHGGRIQASSAGLGKGSEFVVTLPLAVLQTPAQAPIQKELVARERGAVTPRARVLLADDNVLAAKMLALVLKLEGFDVHVVHDGRAALAAIESHDPQILLLDIGMPELDGYGVARTVKERYPQRNIRMIAVTGYGTAADRELALQSGFDAHVTKPADARQLIKLIAQDLNGAVESKA